MSGYFRRVIANRRTEDPHLGILRTLSKHGKLAANEVARLERNVQLLVRTQGVRKKTRVGEPQFRLDVATLASTLGISSTSDLMTVLPEISDSVIEDCRLEHKTMEVQVNSSAFYKHILGSVQKEGEAFGSSSEGGCSVEVPLTVMVEYSSPNIAKPFHAGHLRSTIIGNFVANLYQHVGHTVRRINYLGDWGTQFGLLALGFGRYGDEQLLKDDPLLHLFKVYVQINQEVEQEKKKTDSTYKEGLRLFSSLEQGDPDVVALWKHFRQLSLEEYTKMYERLGVKFTETQYESEFSEKTLRLMELFKEKGILKQDEKGVGYMTVKDRGSDIKATLVKSDGSSLYLARDIAAALDRQERFSLDKMHYVVEGGQQLHFRQLVGALQQLGVPWANSGVEDIHIQFGRIEGMSSRRGTVVFLRDILDEARDRMLHVMTEKKTTRTENLEKVADMLAVSAVIVQDLKARRRNNYTFSWDRMLSLTADSGVFLQYAHARLCSLLASCGVEKTTDVDISCLNSDSAHQLIVLIARYPELVEETLSTLEPCHIVQYLLKLSHLTNSAYSVLPVKGQAVEIAQARLLMFDSARQVLSNGMQLIGLQPLEQM